MDRLTESQKNPPALGVFAGGGEMGALMRRKDWSQSSLGSVETWSQSLKTGIRIILGSRYPMFIWWGHQFINFYNDAYIPILGQRHPAALGQSACDIWADVWDIVGPQAEAVLNKGEASWNKELLMIMERNGYLEETYFTFSYSPIADDDGSPGGVFCAVTEETERVLADRRLRTLRELGTEMAKANTVEEVCRFAANVFTNNPYDIPFALIDRLDNESKQVRLVSTTNSDTIAIAQASERFNQGLLNQGLATLESSVIENVEEQFGALPGGAWSQPPKQAVVLPLHRSGQEPFGFLIAGVSPHRLLDEDYQGFFNIIAGQVTTAIATVRAYEEERASAVSEAARSAALAALDRAKILFFSNISHEFRTPLTLMLSPLKDILALPDDEPIANHRQSLELVHRNGLRLLKLVNTLLDFSRIEAGRMQAVYVPTDLAKFTAELASVFRSAIEQAGLRLIIDCPPLPEPVYVDREMWEKIVLNLLSNAFKFTLEGEIAVRLHPTDNHHVTLQVQDTGTGIGPEELPHVFERFYQVRRTKARTYEGSGIGLALVHELIRLHGGTINVSSTVGQGSCFAIAIPLGKAHLLSDRLRRVVGDSPSETLREPITATRTLASTEIGAAPYVEEVERWLPERAEGKGQKAEAGTDLLPTPTENASRTASRLLPSDARVLLVDDNADMREYLTRILSDRVQVEAVADGASALAAVQERVPDLVLTDVMMPGLDGFELLKVLRANPRTREVPIILLSARAGEESVVEGLEAGADDYLIKPLSAQELISRVNGHLQMAQLRLEALHQERTMNRRKDELLSTVSHELNTPLVAILGWTRLLRANPPNQSMLMKVLETIERNATLQAKLISDLLDMSRITAGKLSLKLEPVKLESVIENAIAAVLTAAIAKDIHLHWNNIGHRASDEPTHQEMTEVFVLGDRDRLQQIITNLLTNAIKFTPNRGSITVKLAVIEVENSSDASIAEISITDTGIGISTEFLPHVFDRFRQAQESSSSKGLGLGLAIARHLVELHGGTIQAESIGVNRGATFTIKLPLLTNR